MLSRILSRHDHPYASFPINTRVFTTSGATASVPLEVKHWVFICQGFGNSKEKVLAFRECFARLGELRSLIPCCTPILALTATAAQRPKLEITKALSLRPDHHEIIVSPDHLNIYLYKAEVNDE